MTTITQQSGTQARGDQPLAERLLDAGIPVVVCTPNPKYGEPGQPELFPPSGWNTITVEQARLDYQAFRPGIDTLAMVAGHGIDVLDIDTKVAGVKLEDVPDGIDKSNGITVTPSQGFHFPVRSTGYSSGSLYFNSKYVGDYCGGTVGGGGRKLVYIEGSSRPKYLGLDYKMVLDWDIDKILDSFTDDLLVTCLEACPGLSDTGHAGAPMAERDDIDGFLADHSEVADCKYGQAAIYGDSLLGTPGLLGQTPDFGNQDNGLHAWITRTVNRATELVKSGCLDASVYSDIEQRVKELAKQHHEPNRYRLKEVTDCLAWAIPNVSEHSGCRKHDPLAKPAAHLQSEPDFWIDRPLLAHIKKCADSRGVSKDAALVAFLARFSTQIRPNVTLPPFVGGKVSLNLYVALVGLPGAGKSATVAAVESMATWGAKKVGAGSGEGLLQSFGQMDKALGRWTQREEAVMVEIDEISLLMAQNARLGNTFIDILTNAWMGAFLHQPYAEPAKDRRMDAHKYRLSMVVGAQPGKIEGLLAHRDSGFPQRFVWVNVGDPTIPHWSERPDHPGLCYPPFRSGVGAPESITFPERIEHEIKEANHARSSNTDWDAAAFDKGAHWYTIRMKVSALLALLDDRTEVTEDDWAISEYLMAKSDATLEQLEIHQSKRRHLAHKAKAEEAATVKYLADEHTVDRVAGVVERHVYKHAQPDGCVKRCITQSIRSTDRPYKDEAIGYALEAQTIVTMGDSKHYGIGPESALQ